MRPEEWYYTCFPLDPSRNNVEAVCHGPGTRSATDVITTRPPLCGSMAGSTGLHSQAEVGLIEARNFAKARPILDRYGARIPRKSLLASKSL